MLLVNTATEMSLCISQFTWSLNYSSDSLFSVRSYSTGQNGVVGIETRWTGRSSNIGRKKVFLLSKTSTPALEAHTAPYSINTGVISRG